jgi:hypothetical protein
VIVAQVSRSSLGIRVAEEYSRHLLQALGEFQWGSERTGDQLAPSSAAVAGHPRRARQRLRSSNALVLVAACPADGEDLERFLTPDKSKETSAPADSLPLPPLHLASLQSPLASRHETTAPTVSAVMQSDIASPAPLPPTPKPQTRLQRRQSSRAPLRRPDADACAAPEPSPGPPPPPPAGASVGRSASSRLWEDLCVPALAQQCRTRRIVLHWLDAAVAGGTGRLPSRHVAAAMRGCGGAVECRVGGVDPRERRTDMEKQEADMEGGERAWRGRRTDLEREESRHREGGERT